MRIGNSSLPKDRVVTGGCFQFVEPTAALRDIYGALSETVKSAAGLVIPPTTAENVKIVLGPGK